MRIRHVTIGCLCLLPLGLLNGCEKKSVETGTTIVGETVASEEQPAGATNGDEAGADAEEVVPAEDRTFAVGELDPAALPDGVEVVGNPVAAARFTDSKGDNIVVLSATEEGPDLHAVHLRIEGAGPQPVAKLEQLSGDCEFDYSAKFVDGALAVTDLDGDDIGEVTVAYKYSCRSDVSPEDFVVAVLEDGKESALRGSEVILFPGEDVPLGDGKSEPSGFEDAPKLLHHAEKVWKRHVLTQY